MHWRQNAPKIAQRGRSVPLTIERLHRLTAFLTSGLGVGISIGLKKGPDSVRSLDSELQFVWGGRAVLFVPSFSFHTVLSIFCGLPTARRRDRSRAESISADCPPTWPLIPVYAESICTVYCGHRPAGLMPTCSAGFSGGCCSRWHHALHCGPDRSSAWPPSS